MRLILVVLALAVSLTAGASPTRIQGPAVYTGIVPILAGLVELSEVEFRRVHLGMRTSIFAWSIEVLNTESAYCEVELEARDVNGLPIIWVTGHGYALPYGSWNILVREVLELPEWEARKIDTFLALSDCL